jgi:trans-feruloyl-CoA hydratase/vanillin synthase
MLLTKNQAVLRGIKIAMKRMRYMDWEASADYLYAKMGEALFFGASDNRASAMKAFLDDKTFKPGIEHYKGTKK